MPHYNYFFSDPECTVTVKRGVIGEFEVVEAGLKNIANWNKYIYHIEEFELDREDPTECIYWVNGLFAGRAKASPNNVWFSLNQMYAGSELFAGNYVLTDIKNQGSSTAVNNDFFISKRGQVELPAYAGGSSSICLRIQGGQYNAETGQYNSIGIWIERYNQTPAYGEGERATWNYFQGTYDAHPEMDFSQKNDSYYSNIGMFRTTMPWGEGGADVKFIAIVCGYDDSGNFPEQFADVGKGCVMLIPEVLWTDSQRLPDPYTPDPEDNKDDAFTIGGVAQTKVGYSSLTNKSPYGLNSSYSGHVFLDQANYSKFLGSVFSTNFKGDYSPLPDVTDADIQGGGYTAFSKIVERMKAAMNQTVLDVAVDTATDAFATSLGITEKIRKAMMDGILSAHVFPKVFSGTSSSITTLSGYELNSAIGCNAITDEIQEKSFSTEIRRPNTSYLGYEPYTTFSVFAPFIGEITIPPSILFDNGVSGTETTGYTLSTPGTATVALYYQIDSYTGLCSCQVYINGGFYCERQGCCASDIPIVGSANTGAAMKGIISGLSSLMTGGVGGFVTDGIPAMIEGVASPQTHPIIGGSNANVASMLSFKTPIWRFSFKVPSMPNPKSYSNIIGGMTNQESTIGSFTGFCQFYDANLSTVTATQAVKEQILSELKSGVII